MIFLLNRSILHIGGVKFSSNCALQTQSQGLHKGWKFKSLDIETGIETFYSWFLISRLELRLCNLNLVIETGIKTFKSWVLISRLESRLLRSRSWYRDWYQDSENRGGSLRLRLSRESLLISDMLHQEGGHQPWSGLPDMHWHRQQRPCWMYWCSG